MSRVRKFIVPLFLHIVLQLLCIITLAQKKPERRLGLEVDNWAIKLSGGETNEVNSLGSLTEQLLEADSIRAFVFLDSLETSKNATGYYFRTFFNMVKADFLYAKFVSPVKIKDRHPKELQRIKEQLIKLQADALDAVYHTENDLQIGWVSFYSARRMRNFGEIGWAVMYSKNGVDLFEKVAYPVEPNVYVELAELLYQVREYEECMLYAKKGIDALKKNEYDEPFRSRVTIRALNVIGTTFYENNKPDSSNVYLNQALQVAEEKKDTIWRGKLLGSIGRLMYSQKKFDSAYLLFRVDYQGNLADSIYSNAANASTWAAKSNLAMGNKVAALAEAREAIHLLSLWPNGPYLRDTYYTLAQIFRAMGSYDSAFYYNDRFTAINDSLEKEVATSSLAISKAKLAYETSKYNIQKLNREKKMELLLRNVIIACIIFFSAIALLMINRKRLQEKMRSQKAEQEIALANEQMQVFTQNIIEKTNLIEKLESQVKDKQATSEQHSVISELSRQTILTEDDWTKFKTLFEKIHPGFFIKLKEKSPDITLAEQRMAALIRLHLNTKQAASMLGISVDSVHKTRQRLRQRLQLSADSGLEETVIAIS